MLTQTVKEFNQLKKLNLKHPALSKYKDWYETWKKLKDGETAGDSLQGKPLLLREIEPHKQEVDGAEMLIALCRAIRRYVVAENADIVAIAL